MRRSVWFGVLGALVLTGAIRPASATCPGDCSGTLTVRINDLITCVSIALDTDPVSACSACDVDKNGMVTVNEVIEAVNAALAGCPGAPTPTPNGMPICGNNVIEADEDCDPPNVGKGCAANCTTETRRTAILNPDESTTPIQTLGTVLTTLPVSGSQTLTTGRARDLAVFGPGNKQLFAPGEAPIAVKAEDVQFDHISVLGLACACIRAIPVPAFGEGISGIGVAGCGDQGLNNVDFLVEQDHDTNPASSGDSGPAMGLADDPECNAQSSANLEGTLAAAGASITSSACLEGVDFTCSHITGSPSQYSKHVAIPSCVGGTAPGSTCSKDADCPGSTCVSGPNEGMPCTTMAECGIGTCQPAVCQSSGTKRPAACNSPRVYTFSGGKARRGSVLLINNTSQTLLPNVAIDACVATKNADGCSAPAFGADCVPCTDDDLLIMPPMTVPTTSGTASIKVYDANDKKGITFGAGLMCGGVPCDGSVTGAVADCDALKNNPNAPLTGALVTAASNLDSQVGDVILPTTLKAQTAP